MRGTLVRLLSVMAVAFLAWHAAGPLAVGGEMSRWGRAAHAVESLWRGDASRQAKAVVRKAVVRAGDLDEYGLHFDGAWQQRTVNKPLVVLLHGFNSTPRTNGAVLKPIRKAGYACATFSFPNDHGIRESASLLSDELRDLARRHPNVRLALVTHSMGGLVARECIENRRLDPDNVDRLIMIAPPNKGTMVAHLAVCADVWEHGLFRRDGGCFARLKDSVVDGLEEASDDLRPGSEFLKRLNARPRNANVEYTMFLGTGGKLREREVDTARSLLQKTTGRVPGLRTATRRLDRCLGDLDEVIDGKGDGAVAIKRALIPGVNDVVVLPFSHMSVTGEPKTTVVREVQEEILARLKTTTNEGREEL